MANGISSMGLNCTSSLLTSPEVRRQNGGPEGPSPETPVNLLTVPSLGTWAEMQKSCASNNRGQAPRNHDTASRNMRPFEPNFEGGITPPRSESPETETDPETDENPFWINSRNSSVISDTENLQIVDYETRRKQHQSTIGKKKGITIASWNIRGKNDSSHNSKWPKIARIMRSKRIAILAVQEARTTEENVDQIENIIPKIKIIANGQYSNKMGVVFAINKDLINETQLEHKVLIPNRASLLKVKWGNNQNLEIGNIYAPNNDAEKVEFFRKLTSKLGKHRSKNLCIVGDFNCIESDVDRNPPNKDNEEVIKSLKKMIEKSGLIDVWRMQNPMGKAFSFIQTSSNSMARIDRIYVHKNLLNYVYDNEVGMGQELSDHDPMFF